MRRVHFILLAAIICLIFSPPAAFLYAQENPKITLKAPGLSEDFQERLKARSQLLSADADEVLSAEETIAIARADYSRLIGALYEDGYFRPEIYIWLDGKEASQVSPLNPPSRISKVIVEVNSGPQFKYSAAVIKPLAPPTRLPDEFAIGKIANTRVMELALAQGIEGWRHVGYPLVKPIQQKIVADHATALVDARFQLDPGPKAVLGKLRFGDKSNVRIKRIYEIAGFPTGKIYSPEHIKKAASRLRRSGAFSSVSMSEAETLSPLNALDVTLKLTDAKPRRYGFGAELSSDDGLKLKGFWLHRNFLGGAERLRIDGEIDGLGGDSADPDYLLSTKFIRPATFTADTNLDLSVALANETEPTYQQESFKVYAGLVHVFSDTLPASIGLQYAYYKVEDDFGTRRFRLLSLPGQITWDKRDDRLNATTGHYLSLQAEPIYNTGNGDLGARLYLDGRAYYQIGGSSDTVVAGRVQLGSVYGLSIGQTPPEYLFFSGGGGTVRGQGYKSLDVDLGGGKSAGGRGFIGASVEFRRKIRKEISGVVFADYGYISASPLFSSNGQSHSGIGVGIRYDTGIGPIRVDVATPLTNKGTSSSLALYIGIGQAF